MLSPLPVRRRRARELGATHVIDAGTTEVGDQIRRITGGGADYAIETTGVPAVLRTAVEALAPTGDDFDRIEDAVHDAEQGTTIKPVLRM